MSLLGLLNTEDFANQRFKNYRQEVFYYLPNGAFPLTGLMSLMDGEDTNDPSFHWWEKRTPQRTTLTAANGGNGAFAAGGTTTPLTAAGWTPTAGLAVRIYVDSTANFRENNVIMIKDAPGTTSTTGDLYFVITSIGSTTVLETRLIEWKGSGAETPLNNASTSLDLKLQVIGSSYKEGATQSSRSIHQIPTELYNYTQIFRKPFKLTETAARTSAKFDSTGPYKDRAKEAEIDHLKEIEFSVLFGRRSLYTNSDTEAQRTTGGILWHMEQYEAADSVYRGGSGATAITADSDDDKRIITNSGEIITENSYDTYLERVFRFSRNRSNELLCICGSGALKAIHSMYKGQSVLQGDFPSKDAYGMNVMRHITPFGDVYYKTHPLFNEDSDRRYWMLFLDVNELKWRYLADRDTTLRKHIEDKRDDYREDEWLTEAGLEMHSPESHLLLKNVKNYSPA